MVAARFSKLVEDYCEYAGSVFRGSGGSCGSMASWARPPVGMFKANFDPHISPNGEVGLVVVIRDNEGDIKLLGVKRVAARWDATTAEAMAALYAVEVAQRLGFGRLVLEGDVIMVINAVKRIQEGVAPLFRIFNDIFLLGESLDVFVYFMLDERAMLSPTG